MKTRISSRSSSWGEHIGQALGNKPQDTKALTKDQYEQAREFEAWQFLRYVAFAEEGKAVTLQNAFTGNTKDTESKIDPSALYLEATGKPAARRDLIAKQQQDVTLAPFASGNLLAKNWFQGDAEAVEGVLAETIENVYSGKLSINRALSLAGERIKVLQK